MSSIWSYALIESSYTVLKNIKNIAIKKSNTK